MSPVIHVILAVDRLLPDYPDEQTFSVSDGMSQTGHKPPLGISLAQALLQACLRGA